MSAKEIFKKHIWKKSLKERWNGPNRGFYRYAAIVTALAALYIVFFSSDNFIRWIGALREKSRGQAEEMYYIRENAKLDTIITRLSTNKDTLVEYARETFYFAAPGDDVYRETEE